MREYKGKSYAAQEKIKTHSKKSALCASLGEGEHKQEYNAPPRAPQGAA